MKTYFTSRIALPGMALIVLLAGLFIQGCGQSGDNQDYILGPSPIANPDETAYMDAMSAEPTDAAGYGGGIKPIPQCEREGTAELKFANYTEHPYAVRINAEDRGTLPPNGGLKFTVKKGMVKWELIPIGVGGRYASGALMAETCGHYEVLAPDKRQGDPIEPIKDNDMMEGQSIPDPYNPFPPCELNGTAEVIFLNFSLQSYFVVFVNGKDYGVLEPQGNLRVVVPEGTVEWALHKKGNDDKPAFTGTLKAKRCGVYTIRAGYDPSKPWNLQHSED